MLGFGGGTHNLDAGTVITPGKVRLSGITTVNVNTSYSIAGTTEIQGGSLNFSVVNASTGGLIQSNGSVNGTRDFTVTGASTITYGDHRGSGTTILQGPSTISSGGFRLDGGRTLRNENTLSWSAGQLLFNNTFNGQSGGLGSGTINNVAGATFIASGDSATDISATNFGGTDNGADALIINAGTFRKSGSTASHTTTVAVGFNNTGSVDVESGSLNFSAYKQTAGETRLNGGTLLSFNDIEITGGTISGQGIIDINNSGIDTLNLDNGTITPGIGTNDYKTIAIEGNLRGSGDSFVDIEIGSLTSFDILNIANAANFVAGDTINIFREAGYTPALGDNFKIITFGSAPGDLSNRLRFSNLAIGSTLTFKPIFNSNDITLQVALIPVLPVITLALSPGAAAEDGATNLLYTFTRTGNTTSVLTVNYGIAGSADSSDYTGARPGVGQTISFAAGSAIATLTIDPTVDTTIEADDTVALTLAAGTGYTVGTATAVVGTILNDDFPVITLVGSPATLTEDGNTNLIYTFTRTGPTIGALTVNYGITGTSDATDYTGATPGTGKTISFAAGSTTATLTIDPTADTTIEVDETVAVTLAAGSGYTVGTTAAVTGTISNDDFPFITLAVSPSAVMEDGSSNLIYTFTRTGPTTSDLTVNYAIAGTAASSDYSGARPGAGQAILFAAGSATASLTINPEADSIHELNEPVDIALIAGTGYIVGTLTAVRGFIINDDSTVTLAVTPSTVTEDGNTNLIYIFTRSGYTGNDLTVNYIIAGTADSSDYTGARPGAGQTISFVAGASQTSLTIDPSADTTGESDETVSLTLASGTGYTVGNTAAVTGTISNDDFPVITLAVSPQAVDEGDPSFFGNLSNRNIITYTFVRFGSVTNALTVNYSIAGTADGSDYTGATAGTGKTITFRPGDSRAFLIIDPIEDNIVESDESVAVSLDPGVGYIIGTTTAVTAIIYNDESPSINLFVSPASVTEDGTANLIFTFTRNGPTIGALTVNYGITGTADATDYTGTTPGTGKTITFDAGASTAILTIDPTADNTFESNDSVVLTLAAGTGYNVGLSSTVVGTISNDDSTVSLAVAPTLVSEDGSTNLIYTFTRTGFTSDALTVHYSIAGTADGSDYTGAIAGTGKTITFVAGATTAILTIDPTADNTVESNETVTLTLAAGTGYTVGTTTAVVGTISNDDSTVTLAVSPSTVKEDGASNLVYTFTRTGFIASALTVNYAVGGTATLGTDYTGIAAIAATKTVSFLAGAATAKVTVDPTADNTVESDETVAFSLFAGTGYTVGTTTAVVGTISNDDTTVTLAVSPATVTEDGIANLVYTFTRTGFIASALTVNYTVGGTATLGTDYIGIAATPGTKTVVFAANSSTAIVTVDPTPDNTVEIILESSSPDESVALTLAAGNGYTVGTTAAVVGTIANDDSLVTLAVSPSTVTEDGTANLIYTFTRTGFIASALTVNYTVGGTATLGTDYTGISATKTVIFEAGSATANVTVDPTADYTLESNETVALKLATGIGYTVGTTTAVVGTIATDDIIGTPAADTLTGSSTSEFIDGSGGQDTMTGGFGPDVFGFKFTQSSITTPDRIIDFEFGSDGVVLFSSKSRALSAPVAFSRAANNDSALTLTALAIDVFSDANGDLMGAQALAANSAVLVKATNVSIAGTYLLINDSIAALNTTNDLMVNITGFSGTFPSLGTIPLIGSIFV